MKLATWNVNSVGARKDRLLAWLAKQQPDVLCLQELKAQDAQFPFAEVAAAGYQAAVHGQKTYNGVAILSRTAGSRTTLGLDDGEDDKQARLIGSTCGGVRVLCAYVPNGQSQDSDKYPYKLSWLDRLLAHLRTHYSAQEPLILCGDFNIAPDARDLSRPEEWQDSVLCTPEVRQRWSELLAWGLHDVFREQHPEGGHYSWWDYRMLGFPKNNGLRIDHILATTPLATCVTSVHIDRDERKGKLPSDHAPVVADFALQQ